MSEVRLINANALKEDLKQYFTDGVLDGVSARVTFNQILLDIDNAPTVEKVINIYPSGDVIVQEKRPQGEWVRKEDIIHYIASQYSEHNELVPTWLNIGNLKGGAS